MGGIAKGAGIAGVGLAGALGGAAKAGLGKPKVAMDMPDPVQESAKSVMGGVVRGATKAGKMAGRGARKFGRAMGGRR